MIKSHLVNINLFKTLKALISSCLKSSTLYNISYVNQNRIFIILHPIFSIKRKKSLVMKRPPKVRPKNLTFGGRYLYGKISF